MADPDKQAVYEDFRCLVNMTGSELEKWLETDEAKTTGWSRRSGKVTEHDPADKSEGYKSGERILSILPRNKSELTEDDYAHMRRVNGYIKRHLGQHANKDIKHTRWRYSLMNWGHDPLK